MTEKTNLKINSQHGKPILVDAFFNPNKAQKPVVIFAHGFKGFKDWGHFNLVAKMFAASGFVFVKFNFSHNGTTPEQPTNFADLEAFGNNNFSLELDDLGEVIDWVCNGNSAILASEVDTGKIYLVGHSRGGGIVILKANEDNRVRKVTTWASVSEYGKYWGHEVMEQWKKDGVMYIANARTNQQMPLYYQMYENYFANLQRLHIPQAARNLKIPVLVVHGTADEAVPFKSGEELAGWCANAKLLTMENAGHTFGGKHPWLYLQLPKDSQKVVEETMLFFRGEVG